MQIKKYIFIFIFLVSLLGLSAQSPSRLIPIQTFTSKDFNSQPKNRAFGEDSFGHIYVGNKEGLLVYNGKWEKYPIENTNDVYSIAVTKENKIFVGGDGEFGFFSVDGSKKGKLIYHPIYKLLDSIQQKNIRIIWHLFERDNHIYFFSKNKLYIYDYHTIKIIDSPSKITFASSLQGHIFVGIEKKGLYEIKDDKFIQIGSKNDFIDKDNALDIKDICNFHNNEYLYINKQNQIIRLSIKGARIKKVRFYTQLDTIFKKQHINLIANLNNTYLAMRSIGNGIFITDFQGKFIRKIDKKDGIANGIIEELYLDHNNILWLAQNGISRVNIFSNYEYLPKDNIGVKGRVIGIEHFNNKTYIATLYRLYALNDFHYKKKKTLNEDELNRIRFSKAIQQNTYSTQKEVYSLLKAKFGTEQKLLYITNDSIFSINSKGTIKNILGISGNVLLQDPMDSNRIWIGLYPKGLGSFYYDHGKWIYEGAIDNTNADIRALQFDTDFNLWIGSINSLLRLSKPVFVNHKIVKPQITHFNKDSGLPKQDAIYPFLVEKQMVFTSSDGLMLYSKKDKHFHFTDEYTNWFKHHFTFRAAVDSQSNIWAVTYPYDRKTIFIKELIKQPNGKYQLVTPYANPSANEGLNIFLINHSLWAGGTPSNIVHIPNVNTVDTSNYNRVYITQVFSNKDTLFNGFYSNKDSIMLAQQTSIMEPILDYKQHNLTFFFAGLSSKLEATPSYRWMLKGYEDNWGDWSKKTEVRFTNLHEGDYTFIVQSKDLYGNISKPATYSFSIKPPWHRTIWAYIAYILLFVAFVWGAINVSTRSLKKIIKEATAEIQAQKDDIEEKNKDIVSSIRYAQRIQEAVSPQKKQMDKLFPQHFVLWKPRDIVSGDFYWMIQKDNKVIIAAADCTGHGVPGAFMSIMGISFLNEIANSKDIITAAEILNRLRNNVITSLNQEGAETDTKDGMDISLCIYDFDNMMMQFAGAYNPLYMIREGELSVIKADRMPIGVHDRSNQEFTNMEFSIHKGDIFYILSDGYIDQFGGPKGKKFMTKRFKELLLEIYMKPMAEQKEILWNTILDWRGDIEQIDDIIIIGIKVE